MQIPILYEDNEVFATSVWNAVLISEPLQELSRDREASRF